MQPKKTFFSILAQAATILILLVPACAAEEQSTSTPGPVPSVDAAGQLTPYRSPTSTVTGTPTNAATTTPLPSPTPTPISHTVVKGEDLFGIALRYGISVEELQSANPTVNPNFLSIGTVLTIPQSKTPQPGGATALPTPAPVSLSPVRCTITREGGVWCALLALNPQEMALESVSVVVRLTDTQAQAILTQPAYLLLDRLPPGAQLPLLAYFPPDQVKSLTPPLAANAEILTALPGAEDGRYLAVKLDQQTARIAEDGLSAEIELTASLEEGSVTAQRLWILAVAYDAQGFVVGARRWENGEGQALVSGQPIRVALQVFSSVGQITRVDLFAEARP